LGPVSKGLFERGEAHAAGVVHQQLLVVLEDLGQRPVVERGDGGHMGHSDLPTQPGCLGGRQLAGRRAQTKMSAHRALGQPCSRGQPGGRALGPVGGPVTRGLETGARFGRKGLEAIELALQLEDRLGVGEASRVTGHQGFDGLRQGLQFHEVH